MIESKYATTHPLERLLLRRFFKRFQRMLDRATGEILDVGAAEGDHYRFFSPRTLRRGVTALEINPQCLPRLKKCSPHVRAVEGSIYDLPFGDDSFDTAVCSQVLEHLDDPEAGMRELCRVARERIILSVPREPIWRICNMLRGMHLSDAGNTPGHVQHWSKRSFVRFVSRYADVREVSCPFPWLVVQARPRPATVRAASGKPFATRATASGAGGLRIMFDVTHPAQVHFFKNCIKRLEQAGHRVLVTSRKKDITLELLEQYDIPNVCLSHQRPGLMALGLELSFRAIRLLIVARRFRPHVMVDRTGLWFSPIARILGTSSIVFQDTEHAKFEMEIGPRFADYICTGSGYLRNHDPGHIRYRGTPHLSYLSPKYFKPDPGIPVRYGLGQDKPYIIFRLVAWQAGHDIGLSGPTKGQIVEVVNRLSKYARVLITSELPLSAPLDKYKCNIAPHHMHDILAGARLYIGDGGSMAAEAAALGVPSVYCNKLKTGYIYALQRDYSLVVNLDSLSEGVVRAERILQDPRSADLWTRRRRKLLNDSQDVMEFMYNTIIRVAQGKSPL